MGRQSERAVISTFRWLLGTFTTMQVRQRWERERGKEGEGGRKGEREEGRRRGRRERRREGEREQGGEEGREGEGGGKGGREGGGEGGRLHYWNFDNFCLDNFVSDSNSNSDQQVSIAAEMSILQNKKDFVGITIISASPMLCQIWIQIPTGRLGSVDGGGDEGMGSNWSCQHYSAVEFPANASDVEGDVVECVSVWGCEVWRWFWVEVWWCTWKLLYLRTCKSKQGNIQQTWTSP